jgi:hypothetical protein
VVTIRFVSLYSTPGVPPDSQTVVVVAVCVGALAPVPTSIPGVGSIQSEVVMGSSPITGAQSIPKSRVSSGSLIHVTACSSPS